MLPIFSSRIIRMISLNNFTGEKLESENYNYYPYYYVFGSAAFVDFFACFPSNFSNYA